MIFVISSTLSAKTQNDSKLFSDKFVNEAVATTCWDRLCFSVVKLKPHTTN